MIEMIMYFGIGFLVAALLGLLFIPLVHVLSRTSSATFVTLFSACSFLS
jgi:hypothetical protein